MTQTLDAKIPAPVLAILIGALTKWYAFSAGIVIDPTIVHMQVGIGLACLSAVIALVAMGSFRRVGTTINPINPQRASCLVTSGIFRWSRNPMYLSLLLLLLAYVIRLESLAVWVGPVFFVAYVTRFQIMPEERALTEKFGDAYMTYKNRTRRWI